MEKTMETVRGIRRVLWVTMGLNVVATVAKLVIGFLTGSLALIADGFDSVFDSLSNVIGLVGVQVAARPADEDHPYGHRKAETLTALIIATLLFITAWELGKSAIERLRDPSLIETEVNLLSFGALFVSVAIHTLVVWYELREGRRLGSDVLVADALHTRADIFVSLAVAAGLIAVHLGFPLADPILALVIAVVIVKIGIDIIRESSPTLMDHVTLPPAEVLNTALSVPGVVSGHQARSRGHDGSIYADLHIRVDPGMSTAQAHAIAHEVQRRLRDSHPDIQDVTIHVEPAEDAARSRREAIEVHLRRLADGLGLSIHDLWAHTMNDKYYVEIDLETDGALSLQQAHGLASSFETRALAEIPDLAELTTHIEPRGQLMEAVDLDVEQGRIAATVRQVVNATTGGDTCHQLQVHRGAAGWAVSFHCRLPGDTPLSQAHSFSTRLESDLRARVPGLERVLIHTEPRQGQ